MRGAATTKDGLSVAEDLEKILDQYAEKLDDTTDEIMDKQARETVQELKNTSPKRPNGGEYAKSWAVKRDKKKHSYIVHNKKHYRLTHLLNNGHVIANQYGVYGRTSGDNHIGKAEDHAKAALIKKLEAKL